MNHWSTNGSHLDHKPLLLSYGAAVCLLVRTPGYSCYWGVAWNSPPHLSLWCFLVKFRLPKKCSLKSRGVWECVCELRREKWPLGEALLMLPNLFSRLLSGIYLADSLWAVQQISSDSRRRRIPALVQVHLEGVSGEPYFVFSIYSSTISKYLFVKWLLQKVFFIKII